MAFQLRRGTDAERTASGGIVFAEGELVYITDTEEVYVGDGVTGGGIRVSGNVTASPATLTRNLALGGFEINGTGDIDITGDITISGSISAANLSGGGTGVIEGQEYAIDILGDVRGADSNVIVDATTGIVYADFVGDGSLITNITLDQLSDVLVANPQENQILKYVSGQWVNATGGGVIENQQYIIDVQGDVIADDSSVIVNASTGAISTDRISSATEVLIGDGPGVKLQNDGSFPGISLTHKATGDLSPVSPVTAYGVIRFQRDDDNGVANGVYAQGGSDGFKLYALSDGATYDETKSIHLNMSGNFSVGVLNGSEKLAVAGSVAIDDGSIRFADDRAIADITDATSGDFKWEANELAPVWYNGANWSKAVGTNLTTGLTEFDGAIKLEQLSQLSINGFNNDSTLATGAIVYNQDEDRFQFFQSGSWIMIPNHGEYNGQLLQWDTEEFQWVFTDFQTPEAGQILQWNGANWAPANNTGGGGGGGGGAFTNIGITADDSTVRLINEGETFGILGGTAISTTSDAEGNITINNDFTQDFSWASITGTPTTVSGYGITDAVVDSDLGNFTFTSSTLDTSDSSGITVTPAMTIQSDLTVENDLRVTNTVYAERFESTTTGTPEIEAATNLNLRAGNAVVITSSPVRMASFTTAERDALASQNGDMIYNETTNKFQGYANGSWVDLH